MLANTGIAVAALVGPEFQITNGSSAAGYGSHLLPLADDAPALMAEINLVLAAPEFSMFTPASD